MSSEPLDRPECVDKVDRDPNIYFFNLDGRYALFRTDGLVAEVSSDVYDLFGDRGQPISQRWRDISARLGDRAMSELRDDIVGIVAAGLLDPTLPRFRSRQVAPTRSAILIMVTQTCNLACVYCYADRGTYHQPTKFQNSENAFAAVDQLIRDGKGHDFLTVTFFGGEPLLDFTLVQRIVEYCAEQTRRTGVEFRYSMTTNATLVTEEVAAYLKTNNFTVLVSFDGDQYFQDKYRPFADGRGSFESVRAGIAKLVAAGLPITLRGTMVREMLRKEVFEQAVATTKALGAKWIHLSPVDCSDVGEATMALRPEDVPFLQKILADFTRENIEHAGDDDIVFDAHSKMLGRLATGRAQGLGRCGAFNGSSAVATNGTIYPCHRFVGMEDYAIGHVNTGGIDSDRVRNLIDAADKATERECEACYARLTCGGVCFHTTVDGQGGFKAPSAFRCDSIRAQLRQSLAFLLHLRDNPDQASRYAKATRA